MKGEEEFQHLIILLIISSPSFIQRASPPSSTTNKINATTEQLVSSHLPDHDCHWLIYWMTPLFLICHQIHKTTRRHNGSSDCTNWIKIGKTSRPFSSHRFSSIWSTQTSRWAATVDPVAVSRPTKGPDVGSSSCCPWRQLSSWSRSP